MQNNPSTSSLVLRRLLNLLNTPTHRHHERYKALVTAKPLDETETLLRSCMSLRFLELADGGNLNSLVEPNSLPSDTSYRGRAIYLHIVHARDDSVARYYVGQAYNLSWRIRQHLDFRYRRDHPALHYWAMNSSDADYFVVLAKLDKNVEHPELVLNILEMWAVLLMQALVPKTKLDEWLPPEVNRLDVMGLNVALPLDASDEKTSHAAFESLKAAEDKMARDYYMYYTNRRLFRKTKNREWEERQGYGATVGMEEQTQADQSPMRNRRQHTNARPGLAASPRNYRQTPRPMYERDTWMSRTSSIGGWIWSECRSFICISAAMFFAGAVGAAVERMRLLPSSELPRPGSVSRPKPSLLRRLGNWPGRRES